MIRPGDRENPPIHRRFAHPGDDTPATWAVRRRRRTAALALTVLAAALAVPATLHWAALAIHHVRLSDAHPFASEGH